MGKMLGIKSIEMYVDLIKNDFGPLISGLEARSAGIKDEVEKQVKIDFGIYSLYEERAALELRLQEIRGKLKDYEDKSYTGDTRRYESKIDQETKERLDKLNAPLLEAMKVEEDLMRQVKLSGVSEDLKNVFNGMPEVLKVLTEKYGSLPPLTFKDVKRLSAPKNVGPKK